MAAKTKPAPASENGATSGVEELVAFVSQNRTKLLRAADEICAAVGRQVTLEQLNNKRVPLSLEERNLFATLGWDIYAIVKNIGRLQRVAELQRTAGTSADRTQAAENLAAATSALETAGPQLEEQIIELQQQLHRLQTSATTAQADVARRSQALERLRSAVPVDVDEECVQQKRKVTARFRASMADLKDLVAELGQPEVEARRQKLEAEMTAALEAIDTEFLEIYAR